MRKYGQRILPIFLLTAFLYFASETVYSQAAQDDSKAETSNGYVSGVTTGRGKSIATGILALVSLGISWRSKVRSAQTGAKVGLVSGLVVIVLSVVHLATTAGEVFGSGSGKAGAIVALLLGLASVVLSIIALRSSKKI